VGQPGRTKRGFPEFEAWEDLIEATARRIHTPEPDELRAELARHLLRLRNQPPKGVRKWEAFLRTALHRKASNWIRNQQTRQKRLISMDTAAKDDASALVDILKSPQPNPDQEIALARAREDLDPKLGPVWDLLREENLNIVQLAERLGIHRNTARARIRKIRQISTSHGLKPADDFRR
jgi:DNA-directed RNA polymerase specialized sigma24 family protein